MKTAMRRTLAGVILLLMMGLASTLRAQSSSPVQYFYDAARRLTSVAGTSGNAAVYNYDAVGNLLSIRRSALPGNNGLAILSFTPQQGPVGSTVTIQGQGFSTTPSANTVRFNGTLAAVSAASATTLTVAVPAGATPGPISVTVGGLDQRVTASGEADKMSLRAPPNVPRFGENDLSRNSCTQAYRSAARLLRLADSHPLDQSGDASTSRSCCYGAPPQKQGCDNYPSRPRSRRTASGMVSSRSATAGVSASAPASRTLSPSPGARKRFNSTPCCLVYNS